jgi:hypothetical protein
MKGRRSLYLALSSPLVAVALFTGGFSVGLASADSGSAAPAKAHAYPDWFLPIWDAYDRNPAITPAFDFAALYSGKPTVG